MSRENMPASLCFLKMNRIKESKELVLVMIKNSSRRVLTLASEGISVIGRGKCKLRKVVS